VLSFDEIVVDGINQDCSMIFHQHLLEAGASTHFQLRQRHPLLEFLGAFGSELSKTAKSNVDHIFLVVALKGKLVLNRYVIDEG